MLKLKPPTPSPDSNQSFCLLAPFSRANSIITCAPNPGPPIPVHLSFSLLIKVPSCLLSGPLGECLTMGMRDGPDLVNMPQCGRVSEQGFPTQLPSVYLAFEAPSFRPHHSVLSTVSGGWLGCFPFKTVVQTGQKPHSWFLLTQLTRLAFKICTRH